MENNQISILRSTFEQTLAHNEGQGRRITKLLFSNADIKIILDALALKESTQQNGGCVDLRSRKAPPFMQRELSETVAGMTSPDYQERFRAEYIQTKIRYERLKAFNTKIEAAFRTECERPEVEKAPMPPHDLLREQQSVMGQYLHLLEIRAVIEGVDLGGC